MTNNNAFGSRVLQGVFLAVLLAVFGLTACGSGGGSTTTTNTSPTTLPAPGGIVLSLVPARTSGVAPLAVFFDASGTTDIGVTTRPFHDLEYTWSFGDPGSGTWTSGAQPGVSSKNSATGPVAAHVFETPGTYTVSVTAFDGTNTASTNTTITVQDPDVVFAGSNTVCVSNSGEFTGCPSGATHATSTSSFATALANISGTKKRLLFRAGETWTVSASNTISLTGPGYIGTYGAGTAPRIQATGNFNMLVFSAPDWRLVGLELDGQDNSVYGVSINGVNQITLLRLNVHNLHSAFSTNNFSPLSDQLAIHDTSWTTIDTGIPTGGGNGAWIFAQRFSFQGNTVDNGGGGEHVIRLPLLKKAVIGQNTFSGPALNKHFIKLHQANPTATQETWDGNYTEQVLITGNTFTPSTNAAWIVTVGPQNTFYDEHVKDIIVDLNWFRAGTGAQVPLFISTMDTTTVRNNIIDMSLQVYHTGIRIGKASSNLPLAPWPNDVRVYNNTCFSSSTGDFICVRIDSGSTNSIVHNNLGSAPLSSNPTMVQDAGTNTVQGSNLFDTPSALFVSAAPAVPADFILKSQPNPARDAGTVVPVWSDFFRTSRPQNGVIDIGAVE